MFKSTDEKVTTDLIETLRDGEKGYAEAAEKMDETGRQDLRDRFRTFSAQRRMFAEELEGLAKQYGDDIDESGSVAAAVHRGWISLKTALSGDDAEAVVGAVVTGENHAVTEYEKALEEEISPHLRAVVARQLTDVRAAATEMKALDVVHS